MDQLNKLLKDLDQSRRAPLPQGFEEKVVNKWFNQVSKKEDYSALKYIAAACLITLSLINILSLTEYKEPAEISIQVTSDTASENQFAEEYGLVEQSTYYSLNQ